MSDTASLYDRFKFRVKLRALYAKCITLLHKKGNRAEYIFGIETRDDELHNDVIKAIERCAQEQVEWLFIELCMAYGYPVEMATGNGRCMIEHDILFEKDDRLIQVDFKSVLNPVELSVDSPARAKNKRRKQHSGDEDTYIVYLLKKNPEGDAWIENNSNPESPVKVVLVSDFIAEIFGKGEAEKFEAAMRNFSKDMRKELGYSISRIGSERALERLRVDLETEIPGFDYFRIKQSNSEMFPMDPYIDSVLFRKIQQRFGFNFKLLLGKNDFAVSFLTSEWLYRQDNELNGADYTYVAAGYFKSVEQLLWDVLLVVCPDGYIGRDGIRIADVNLKTNDSALGALCYFFNNGSNTKLFNDDLGDEKDTVRECFAYYLNQWTTTTRNGYFHKHILNKAELNKIREQTYLLYFLALGSLRLSNEQRAQLMD